jgi:hypothetical protein
MKHSILRLLVVATFCMGDVHAQVLRPIDPNKRASEVENKSVQFGNVHLETLTHGTRDIKIAPGSGKNASFKNVNLSDVDLKTLSFSDLPMKTLPRQNFMAKRAVLPDKAPPQEQLGLSRTKAPITKREIRAFTPEGEEELKRQLHGLPPPYGASTIQSPPPSGQ